MSAQLSLATIAPEVFVASMKDAVDSEEGCDRRRMATLGLMTPKCGAMSRCAATRKAADGADEMGPDNSVFFVNTYDEFEQFDEDASDSQDLSETTSDSGERSDDQDAAVEPGKTGVLSISTVDVGGGWDASRTGSPASADPVSFELPWVWDQPHGAAQDPCGRSPTGLLHVAMGAEGVHVQPPWAGGPEPFFSCPVGSPHHTPAMPGALPMGVPAMYAPGACPWLPAACLPPAPAHGYPVPLPARAPLPGSWSPPTACPAHPPSIQAASAPSGAAGPSICLVRAIRQPSPLKHNKSHPVTSLTINHLPFLMRQSELRNLLDQMGFASRYDYLYVPCNRDKTNRGHAFINFCSPEDAREFFAGWHGARIVGVSSDAPVLSVAVSVVQGFEASIQRWTMARLLSVKDPDFKPFIAGMDSILG